MPRPTTLPAMSCTDFRELAYVVARTMDELAPLLNRSQSTLCSYVSGRKAVPNDVAEKLRELCRLKVEKLTANGRIDQALAQTRAENYARLVAESEKAAEVIRLRTGSLSMRRSRATPRQYPPYRMTHEKLMLLARAFKRYLGFIRGERQVSVDPHRIQDLDMEIADITRLARQAIEVIQAAPPYNYHINNLEWYVVSRALRFLDTADGVVQARSLYQHWRKYKGMHFVKHGKYSYRGAVPAHLPIATANSTPLPVTQDVNHETETDLDSAIENILGVGDENN